MCSPGLTGDQQWWLGFAAGLYEPVWRSAVGQGWRVGPARTDGAERETGGSQVAAQLSLARGILEGDIKE